MDGNKFVQPDLNSPNNNADPNGIGFGAGDDFSYNSSSDNNDSVVSGNTYFCQSCNTTFISNVPVDSCIFCSSTSLVKTDSFTYQGTYKLPFLKTIDDANDAYKKCVRFNLFLPSYLRKKVFSQIKKVYIPGILYGINIKGNVKFICANEIDKKRNVPVQSYEVLYDTNFDYNPILVSDYSNISSEIMNSIHDYNFGNLISFDSMDADTYYINSSSSNLKDVDNQAIKSSLGIIKSNIHYTFKKVKSNELVVNETEKKCVLLPVYMLHVTYKENDYFYLMNGQTGKAYSNFNISVKNILIVSIIVFIIIFVILFLIAYFF